MRRFVTFAAAVGVIVLTVAGVHAGTNSSTVSVPVAVGLCNKHGGMKNGGCAYSSGDGIVDVDCNGKSGCTVSVTTAQVSHQHKRPPSGGTTAH